MSGSEQKQESCQLPVASKSSLSGNWQLATGNFSSATGHSFAPAAELRRRFDESFALPPATPPQAPQDFLAIRVGNGHYAIRVSDLTSLAGRRKIVPLPPTHPALLGLAGTQGRLVPVYGLAALIGAPAGQEETSWLAVCGRQDPVALAFPALEGHLRVHQADLFQPGPGERRYVCAALRLASDVRYVLDLPSILASIRDRAGLAASTSGR